MSKDIFQTAGLNENLSQDETAAVDSELESTFDQDNVVEAFLKAVYEAKGRIIDIGGLEIWFSGDNILKYEIIDPSEANESILSILLAMSLENDITLKEIKLKEKILTVEDDNTRIIDFLYSLIKTSDFEPLNYIKDLIERGGGKFNINMVYSGLELPLIYALKNGTTFDVIQCLVEEFGCDVNILDQEGHSPLYHAFNAGNASITKNKIIEYLMESNAFLTDSEKIMRPSSLVNTNEPISNTKQIAYDIEVATFYQGTENNNQTSDTDDNQLITCFDTATKSKKKIAIEGTNFVLQKKVNGVLNVSNDEESEIFLILSKIVRAKGAELEFIYDKHTASSLETFTGCNYDDLISQVLNDKKCLYLPPVDFIFQNNGNAGIECFIGKVTFDKLGLLCDIAKRTGKTLTCDGLRSLDVPQKQQIPLEKPVITDVTCDEPGDACILLGEQKLPESMDLPD